MALRVRWYLSRCQQDAAGRWQAWVSRSFIGYAYTVRAPTNQVALVRLHGEEAELDRIEALPGFTVNVRTLRLGTDPLYSTINTPAVRLLMAEWGIDGATIPGGTTVREMVRLLGRVSDDRFDEWGAVTSGFAGERFVD